MNYEKAIQNIQTELKIYIQTHKLESLILGVSGGMDSALVAALARPVCDELRIKLVGRSLPISTNKPDELERANAIGKAFCHDYEEVSLAKYYNELAEINPDPGFDTKAWQIRNGNIKARIRMIFLYNLASTHRGIVLSTDNYTEYLLGFWTLHGDVGDYGMIQELWKTEVYDMGEFMVRYGLRTEKERSALKSCILCNATDGLGITNSDLDQLMPGWTGSSREGYKAVDSVLKVWTTLHRLESTQKTLIAQAYENNPVVERHLRTEFKRQNPLNIKRGVILKNAE